MNVKIVNGFIAGFVATLVLSAMMIAKAMMGLMPALDVAAMLSMMMGAPIIVGWLAHFMIGTIVWGGAFVVLNAYLPGKALWLKGISFGVAAWLGMMIVIMPMAGAGLFGMNMGMMAPVMTLVLHVIYGAVLGATYAALPQKAATA